MSDTPRTDAFFARNTSLMEKWEAMKVFERELAEAIESLTRCSTAHADLGQRMRARVSEVEQQRDRLTEALEYAEALANAWVAYWATSPAYGNGTAHPDHVSGLEKIAKALASVKEKQP